MPLKSRDMIDRNDPRVAQIGHPAPPWMVNYADLMTEMVCFFLILYALSASLSKPMQEAKKEIDQTIKNQEVAGEVKMTKEGLVITLQEAGYHVFFKSGSAELSGQMKKILDELSPTFNKLASKRHDMIVQGHTDNVPIRTREFKSNWELSTARATNVVQYLLTKHGYPPTHIGAIGYGEYRELEKKPDEDLDSWRSRKRRVVFIVKNPPPKKTSEKKI